MKTDGKAQVVGGYIFHTEEDARLANAEQQKIKYLEERIDYDSPESINYIYEKAIQDRIFRTPVGMRYLKHLQDFLLEQPGFDSENVAAIPLGITFAGGEKEQEQSVRKTPRDSQPEPDRQKYVFIISVISNVLLAIAICAMFAISLKSDQPNIFNYERAIRDKYSAWEQELTEREQKIRDKELELKLNQ